MSSSKKHFDFSIKCTNVAPLRSFESTFRSPKVRVAILANNGSGKTYLSRMFRLIERAPVLDGAEGPTTDRLITFNEEKASFTFKLDKTAYQNGNPQVTALEDISFVVQKGHPPQIPASNFIYHCFNEDYVEENIAALDFEFNENIDGIILGKANIDLSLEEKKLDDLQKREELLKFQIQDRIDSRTAELRRNIPRVTMISEYEPCTTIQGVTSRLESPWQISSTYENLSSRYEKIRMIPDGLQDIEILPYVDPPASFITDLIETLRTPFLEGDFLEEFRKEVLAKQSFIEAGLSLMTREDRCPFCKQSLTEAALELIKKYNQFIFDEEAKTRKRLSEFEASLNQLAKWARGAMFESNNRSTQFHKYRTEYGLESETVELDRIQSERTDAVLEPLRVAIRTKIADIKLSVEVNEVDLFAINECLRSVSEKLKQSNQSINRINEMKNSSTLELREIKRDLCKATLNNLIAENREDIRALTAIQQEKTQVEDDIQKQRETVQTDRRGVVASTVQAALTRFFGGKYELDEQTFRLMINKRVLNKGQVRRVLSSGEKNVIAFAYFLGDAHLKINTVTDYEKMFFVLDDPISSMDFHHTYSVVGTIKRLASFYDNTPINYLVLTHSIEFLRILESTETVSKCMIMFENKLAICNQSLTVPYVNHLLDIHKISKGDPPTHTTANSIRHIIETLSKFDQLDGSRDAVTAYIDRFLSVNTKVHTVIHSLMNDLSHGNWRSESKPIFDKEYQDVCSVVVDHIRSKHPGQVAFCEKATS